MKKTLLDMVQSILSSMDSDEVSSFADTVESLQVANALRDSYFEITAGTNPPNTFVLFSLDATGNPALPTAMVLPSEINSLQWVKYDIHTLANPLPNFVDLQYLPPSDFFQLMYQLGTNGEADVGTYNGISVVEGDQIPLYYRNDRAPQFYTSVNDNVILFDSFDSAVDTTLQSAKTVCAGERSEPWSFTDAFIPALPDHLFPLLENEAKKQCFIEFKQSANPLAEERAHRGWVRQRRVKQRVPSMGAAHVNSLTNYSRHGALYTGPFRNYGK